MLNTMSKIVDGLLLSGNPDELAFMKILSIAVPIFADLAFCFGDEFVELVCLTLQGKCLELILGLQSKLRLATDSSPITTKLYSESLRVLSLIRESLQ
jgi:hypothetical protein